MRRKEACSREPITEQRLLRLREQRPIGKENFSAGVSSQSEHRIHCDHQPIGAQGALQLQPIKPRVNLQPQPIRTRHVLDQPPNRQGRFPSQAANQDPAPSTAPRPAANQKAEPPTHPTPPRIPVAKETRLLGGVARDSVAMATSGHHRDGCRGDARPVTGASPWQRRASPG